MNSLGGVTLPTGAGNGAGAGHLVWINRNQWAPVQQDARRTLGGTLRVAEAQLAGGRPIVLQASTTTCWLRKACADALYALASVPGEHALVLEEYGLSTTVIFDHSQGNAVELYSSNKFDGNAEWYVGTIRLLEKD